MLSKTFIKLSSVCMALFLTASIFPSSYAVASSGSVASNSNSNSSISYSSVDGEMFTIIATPVDIKTVKSPDDIYTCENDIDFKIYEGILDAKEIQSTGISTNSLTRFDEEENSMGNIRAKLSVSYKKGKINNDDTLTLLSATSSYKTLAHNGVVAQTSKLYYNVEGSLYKNGKRIRGAIMGFTKKYSTPTFTSVTLMGPSYAVGDPIAAGVRYTLYCSRGVTINVSVSFA